MPLPTLVLSAGEAVSTASKRLSPRHRAPAAVLPAGASVFKRSGAPGANAGSASRDQPVKLGCLIAPSTAICFPPHVSFC